MKRGGRRTLLTKPLQRKIERLLAQGHTIATVCQTVAIGERTYYQWCARSRQFAQATTCAIGKSKIALVNKLRRSDDWRAAGWLLERRFPADFAPYDRRPIPVEPEPLEKKINVAFIVDTKGKSLEEVASFPVLTPEEIAQKAPEREPEPNAGRIVRRQYRQARTGCARFAVRWQRQLTVQGC